MEKISGKKLVQFRHKSDRAKKSFAVGLKKNKVKSNAESGGDYWISSLSAISNSFKFDDLQYIIDKKGEIEDKLEDNEDERIQEMYIRNIDILYHYEDFDLKKWRPVKKIKLLPKDKKNSILIIKGLPVQALPHHIFTFKKNDVEEIGAIWFIAKLNGFRKEELGLFVDILYRYLKAHFSEDYNLNPQYCIAVDVFNCFEVNYSQLAKGKIPVILDGILDEINDLL
jgi:hypothetical protein